jgi:hypothetical protein
MCDYPCRVQIIKLCLHGASEYSALHARDISCDHGSLVYAIQNPWHGGKKIGLEDLRIFK